MLTHLLHKPYTVEMQFREDYLEKFMEQRTVKHSESSIRPLSLLCRVQHNTIGGHFRKPYMYLCLGKVEAGRLHHSGLVSNEKFGWLLCGIFNQWL